MGLANGIRAMNLTHTGELGYVLYIPNEVGKNKNPVSVREEHVPISRWWKDGMDAQISALAVRSVMLSYNWRLKS